MDDSDDDALEFEILTAALKMDQKQAQSLVESLATMLQTALPDAVTVTRGGWLLAKDKPVQELLVQFEDVHYKIVRGKSGSYDASQLKIARGIVLKTVNCDLDTCFKEILKGVSRQAGKNASARDALSKFVTGI